MCKRADSHTDRWGEGFAGCFGLCTLHCVHRIKAVSRTGTGFRALRCVKGSIRTPDRCFGLRGVQKPRFAHRTGASGFAVCKRVDSHTGQGISEAGI